MGPSGSGKTTLLTIAGALLKPTRGGVRIWDTDITEMDKAHLASIRREKVAFVYQSFNLLEALTALENVSLVLPQRALNGATADLDAKRGHEVMELLRQKVLETNKAVVIVSHDHRIRDVADRVVQSEDGRLQAES